MYDPHDTAVDVAMGTFYMSYLLNKAPVQTGHIFTEYISCYYTQVWSYPTCPPLVEEKTLFNALKCDRRKLLQMLEQQLFIAR